MHSDIEIQPGKILTVFSKEESEAIEKKWMSIFCKNKQGFNTKSYKWHIFSGKGYPSTDGEHAHKNYSEQVTVTYLVMGNNHELVIKTDTLPTKSNLSDFYVFPENMAWTMAFTHEEGWLGPYFAKHPNYKKLNDDNLKQLEKEHKKQVAKQKGWY